MPTLQHQHQQQQKSDTKTSQYSPIHSELEGEGGEGGGVSRLIYNPILISVYLAIFTIDIRSIPEAFNIKTNIDTILRYIMRRRKRERERERERDWRGGHHQSIAGAGYCSSGAAAGAPNAGAESDKQFGDLLPNYWPTYKPALQVIGHYRGEEGPLEDDSDRKSLAVHILYLNIRNFPSCSSSSSCLSPSSLINVSQMQNGLQLPLSYSFSFLPSFLPFFLPSFLPSYF